MSEHILDVFDEAEENSDGDLVVTREGRMGNEHDVNLTKLFRPGKRKTGNVDMLLIEARLADENPDKDRNPAFPVNGDVADEALDRMESERLEPAWLQGPSDGNY